MTDTTIKRRRYGPALKAQILAQCEQPGMSVARVAMAHGINANVVHKWRRQALACGTPVTIPPMGGFIPVPITPAASSVPADIRIELRRGPLTLTLSWPMAAATECAHWLREVLR
jgi:transposase